NPHERREYHFRINQNFKERSKMSELNEAILAKIEETANKINDYDQRSAIGMARSWVEHGRLDTWNPERHKDMIQYPNRDQLATDLVAIFEDSGAENDEMVE